MNIIKSTPRDVIDSKTVKIGSGLAPRVKLTTPRGVSDAKSVKIGSGLAPRPKR